MITNMTRITESDSRHDHLEQKSIEEITSLINQEDKTVAEAIDVALPALQNLIAAIVQKIETGGRLFYVGAGSGGRLSVLDVIELPTTYGIEKGVFNAILAGGIPRLADALEEKEDDPEAGWDALREAEVNANDIVVGISASGSTPFVLGALRQCIAAGIATGCIVSNPGSEIASYTDFPVEVITGPEFITGSTRMKCGTAQKMIFDMISTTTMIRLGRVKGNKMVNVKLINDKIVDRAVKMLMRMGNISDYTEAKELLVSRGSVSNAMDFLETK